MSYYFVSDAIDNLKNKKIKSITMTTDKESFTFEMEDGTTSTFGVEGDCCSQSWIEYMTVPNDMSGATLLDFEESSYVADTAPDHNCLKVYQSYFKTDRGDIVLEYRNSSNGYYGGYLTVIK